MNFNIFTWLKVIAPIVILVFLVGSQDNGYGQTLSAPQITTQPIDTRVIYGELGVTFTVAATGNPTPSYQWMMQPPGSTSFTPIAGATSAIYKKTSYAVLEDSGTKYKCVVTNSEGSVTSREATLVVLPGFCIMR